MLILTRKPLEAIVIGDTVELTVLGIEGDRVKLGISAPGDVSVLRKELWVEIGQENRAAAAGTDATTAAAMRRATQFHIRARNQPQEE